MPLSCDQKAAASAVPPSGLKFRGHIPALDGLRGVAILMVLMLHFYNEAAINAQYPLFGPIVTKLALSGLYGVQLFFVLSGFLITGILLDSKGGANYFRNFYMRRFLRIFPLYYGTLCVLFLILPHVVPFDEGAQDIASRQGWLWAYLSNLPWSGSNWDSSNVFRLGHFWSLCVEEHFYFLWPLVVYACSKQKLVRLCVIIMVCCLLVRLIHTVADGPRLFEWSSIWKLDGLALGSLLAASLRESSLSFRLSRYAPRIATVF